ncbi:ThuA domain-containing protein [Lysobacter spongiae]|uniref:ThuA domain-containing protein n=2 Tax=Marilutibacter spongiae TaxID=2025720 RepID=A0A7W3TJW8_9GAMM|nr:ThuA domain-containing protein [Lysobacter spongiae]
MAALLAAGCSRGSRPVATPRLADGAPLRVLVFTRTSGWRHDSIPDAIAALRAIAGELGMEVVATEDATAFSPASLAGYDAVVFASTTRDVLDDAQQRAFEAYMRDGGGYMGIHAAADTEYDWPWYGDLVGAWFANHPEGLQATQVRFEQPGVLDEGESWPATDEIYNYRRNPRGRVRVIATVDETTYDGGTMGDDHPIAWCHRPGRGRAWYTGLGHTRAMYADPRFRRHLARGLRFASGVDAAC